MDWLSVFLLIFSLTALIASIANAIYYWRAYSLPVIGISTGTSITLLIVNVIVALLALAGLIWSLYTLFTSRGGTEETVVPGVGTVVPGVGTVVPGGNRACEGVRVQPSAPNASVIVSRV